MASGPGADVDRPEAAALVALERAVEEALARLRDALERATVAEARTAELQRIVERVTGDSGEARRLVGTLGSLEEENGELRRRVEEGRAGVERLLAKIRFLEDQR
jgi:predicted RNase H-like nuclease (RuvC/YqgF family)